MKLHTTIKGKWSGVDCQHVMRLGPFVARLSVIDGHYWYQLSNDHGVTFKYEGWGRAKTIDEARNVVERAIATLHYVDSRKR